MIKTCPVCGDEFEGDGRQVYCSGYCYKQNKIQHNVVRNRQARAMTRREEQIRLWLEVIKLIEVDKTVESLMDMYYIRKRTIKRK